MNKTIRILHLEDKRSEGDIVKRELTKSEIQFELLWVINKKEFQKALEEFNPDIILSDHSLPSFTSIQALKIVREAGIDIPFILVTATMSDEAAVGFIKEGITDYILKDRLSRLPNAILTALDNYKNEKEKESYHAEIVRNEKLFRAVIENCADMITLAIPEGNFFYASPSVTNILGFTSEEYFNRPAFEFIHPEDLPGLIEQMTEIINGPGKSFYCKQRMLHKNGHYIWCEGTVTNMLHDPNVKALVSNFRDITERQISDEILKQKENHLKKAQHIGHIGGWEIDLADNTSSWSDEMYIIFGADKNDVLPTTESFLSFVHPDDTESSIKFIADRFLSLIDSSFNFRFIRKDGILRYGYSESKFELSAEGKPLRLFGIIQDITERKQAEINLALEIRLSKKHESMLLSSQINPHFIFNALNSVQYFILLKENVELALNFVADFSLLMRSALKNSRSEFILISEEIKFLELYLKLEHQRSQKKFSYRVVTDRSIHEEDLHIPPMVVQPYLENAVLHGVANSAHETEILIHFSKKNNQVVCKISDNGIGRKKAMELKNEKQEQNHHESMGMKITGRRIKLLNELYHNSFVVDVTDLSTNKGDSTGTEVEIRFPILNEETIFELA